MVKGLQPLVWATVFFLAAATTSAESISVQVQQDAYRVSDVSATGLEVEIRVQNQGPETFENVLLTLPSQNVLSAHPKPAASGTNLVWTVGNLIDGDSFSVRLRVDGSAEGIRLNDVRATGAFGTMRRDITGRVVRLEGPNFPADKLLASADADPTDPAIIHQAGVLGGDPDRIFAFVKSLKHQFYTGSLHGARGALYAGAANRVDRASLLVTLLRASGLPAVYRAGTLTAADQLRLATQALATSGALAGVPLTASQMRAQPELALALLPSFEVFNLGATTAQRVAAIRALSDEDLLELVFAPSMPAEVTTYAADQHVWVEAYINGSWVAMDPSFLDAEPGDVIGVPGQQLTGIPEAWRHRVVVSVFHEQMTPTFATGLNLQNPSLVLTRGAGELVGKPVIVSHTTETSSSFGMISYTAQAKYTPTFEVRDLERLDASERIEGQTYTELVSSFGGGISNTYVTSAWLGVELLAPGQMPGQGQVLVQNLADRVGFEARNGVATDLNIDFQVRALDAVDMTTLLIQASHLPARTTRTALQVLSSITEQAQANAAAAELLDPVAAPTSEDIEGLKIYAQALTAGLGALHSSNMGERMQRLAEAKQQLPFNVAPRVTSAFARINTKTLRAIYGIDLMHERIEAVSLPGAPVGDLHAFKMAYGAATSEAESAIMQKAFGPNGVVSAETILSAAAQQGLRTVYLTGQTGIAYVNSDAFAVSPEARIRMRQALLQGDAVITPTSSVVIGDEPRSAWFELSPDGNFLGRTDTGAGGAMLSYATLIQGITCSLIACGPSRDSVISGILGFLGHTYSLINFGVAAAGTCAAGFTGVCEKLTSPAWQNAVNAAINNAIKSLNYGGEVDRQCSSPIVAIGGWEIGEVVGDAFTQLPFEGSISGACAFIKAWKTTQDSLQAVLSDPIVQPRPAGVMAPVGGDARDRYTALQTRTVVASLPRVSVVGTVESSMTTVAGTGSMAFLSNTEHSWVLSSLLGNGVIVQDDTPLGTDDFEWVGASNTFAIQDEAGFDVAGTYAATHYPGALLGVTAVATFGTPGEGDTSFEVMLGANATADWSMQDGPILEQARSGAITVGGQAQPNAAFKTTGSATGRGHFLSSLGVDSVEHTLNADGVLRLAEATGTLQIDGNSQAISQALTFAGATGTVAVLSNGASDTVQINLMNAHQANLAASPATSTGFEPVLVDVQLASSLGGDWTLRAQGPQDVALSWVNGQLRVAVNAAAEPGAKLIVIQAHGPQGLVATDWMIYTFAPPAQDVVRIEVVENPRYSVDQDGARETARLLAITHYGAAPATYVLDASVDHDAMNVTLASQQVTLRPGHTEYVGFSVSPRAAWPAPGTTYNVTFSAQSAASHQVVWNQTVQEIRGWRVTSPERIIYVNPGERRTLAVAVTNTGNVGRTPLLQVDSRPTITVQPTPLSTVVLPGQTANFELEVVGPALLSGALPSFHTVSVQIPPTAFEVERGLSGPGTTFEVVVVDPNASLVQAYFDTMATEDFSLAGNVLAVGIQQDRAIDGCEQSNVDALITTLNALRSAAASRSLTDLVATIDASISDLQANGCQALDSLNTLADGLVAFTGLPNLSANLTVPSPATNGQLVTLSGNVVNTGTTDVGVVSATLSIRRGIDTPQELQTFEIGPIAAGGSMPINFPLDTTNLLGTYVVTLRADSAGVLVERNESDNAILATLVVNPANQEPLGNVAPVFTSVPPTVASVGSALTYTPTATDADGDTVFIDAPVRAPGLKFENGALIGKPLRAGTFDMVLIAADRWGATTSQEFVLDVSTLPLTNALPRVTSRPVRRLVVGQPWTYSATAMDEDLGDVVTLSTLDLPSGATFTPAGANGTVSWTPQTGDVGQHWFALQATDSRGGVTTHRFVVDVAASARGADLIISAIDTSNSPITNSTRSGSIDVTIANIGDTPSTPSDVELYEEADFAAGRSPQDLLFGSENVPALNPGESVVVGVSVAGAVAFDGNIVYATVDPLDVVTEADETNNTRFSSQPEEPLVGTYVGVQDQESGLILLARQETSYQVLDAATGLVLSSGVLDAMTPVQVDVAYDDNGTLTPLLDAFVVQASAPIQAYLTHEIFVDDFGGDFYHQAHDGNRVGKEFTLFAPTLTVNNRIIVIALEDAAVRLDDPFGTNLALLGLVKGQAWEPQGLTQDQIYTLTSTGNLVVHSASVTGMSVVPPADLALAARGDVGTLFRFNIRARGPNGGAIAVFAYEDAEYQVFREDQSPLTSGTIRAGETHFQTGFGNLSGLRLEATGPVMVIAGDMSRAGASDINFMGEDITQVAGIAGKTIVTHTMQSDGGDTVLLAGPDGAAVSVNGVISTIAPFGKLALTDGQMVTVLSSSPVIAQVFGGGDRFFDQGDMLRPFPVDVAEADVALDRVVFQTASCASGLDVQLRVGNRGGAMLSAASRVELVEMSSSGEVVLGSEVVGRELAPGQWVDLQITAQSQASEGVARSWLVRLIDAGGETLTWSSGPSGFASTNCANLPPIFTSVPPTAVNEGTRLDYIVTATDPEGQTVTFALLNAPVGANITASGVLTWPASDIDAASFTVIAQDSGGASALHTFTVTVNPGPDTCTGTDADGDGFCVPEDCNDTETAINPASPEVLGNGLDDDCNAFTTDTVSPASLNFRVFTTSQVYDAFDTAQLSHRLTNLSPIQALGQVVATTTAECNGLDPVEFSDTITLGPVGPGSGQTQVLDWDLAGTVLGTCDVQSVLRAGSVELARSNTTFSIGTHLSGTLVASASDVLRGAPVNLDWEVQNPGTQNTDAQVQISAIGLINPFESTRVTVVAGAAQNGSVEVDTNTLSPGFYAVVLKVNGVQLALTTLNVFESIKLEAMQVDTLDEASLDNADPQPLRYQPRGAISGGPSQGGTIRAVWSNTGLLIELRRTDSTSDQDDAVLMRIGRDNTILGEAQWIRSSSEVASIGQATEQSETDTLIFVWNISNAELGALNVDDELQLLVSVRDGDAITPREVWMWATGVTETLDNINTFGTVVLVEAEEEPNANNNNNNSNNNNATNNNNNATNNNNTNGTNNQTTPDRVDGADDGCGCAASGQGPEPGSFALFVFLGLWMMGRRFGTSKQMLRRLSSMLAVLVLFAACGDDTTQTPTPPNNTQTDVGDTGTDTNSDAGEDADSGANNTPDMESDSAPDSDPEEGTIGTVCESNDDCFSGICLVGPEYSLCTRACDLLECVNGWTCERFPGGGQACVPSNICVDHDGDGYGAGRACLGPDCNDRNPDQNPGASEVCNGIDDNCDGEADEDLLNACGTCGELPAEVCNGVDDNCDGIIDDGVLNTCGVCGEVPTEICNGIDDDCDGAIDENVCGNRCVEGSTRSCYEGPPGTLGVGSCANGAQTCVGGEWSECTNQSQPEPETCDGVDNDCDGLTDENLLNSCGTCGVNPREICNGIDDDCDGTIDEGALNRCGTCGPCGESQIFPGESGFGDPTVAPAPDGGITLGQGSVSRNAIWVPNSNEDTVSRWNTRTGREEARVWIGEDPSRTSVDLIGNAWVAHRGDGLASYIIANPADCIDRNGDGVIQTSRDLNGDGRITGGEILNSPEDPFADECLKCQVRLGSATDLVRGVAVDANNDAWFGTWQSQEVFRVDSECNILNTVPVNQNVYGVVINSNGHLFTSGYTSNCTVEIDTETATIVGRHCGPTGIRYGIAVDGDDDVWFADNVKGFWQYQPTTDTWTRHTYPGTQPFSFTTGIVVGLDGSVYAAGYNSDSIGKFRPSTQEWEIFSTRATATGLLDQTSPRGVTIDSDGNLWAIALSSSGLLKMRPDGQPLGSYKIVKYDNPSQGVAPYSYSDNTGFQLLNYTANEGTWRNIFDAGQLVRFRSLTWTAFLPPGSAVEVRVRASDDRATLDQQTWTIFYATTPVDLFNLVPADMRYLEMEFELTSTTVLNKPVLRDIQVFFETDDCRDPQTPCPGGQICDTIQGGCIVVPTQCSDDTACGTDEFCDANGYCRIGCRTAPDSCGIGALCNPVLRRCEARSLDCFSDAECAFDSYCSSSQFCEKGCRQLPDNCPVRFTCNPVSHLCDPLPPECAADTDCPNGEYCDSVGRCASGCRLSDASTCPGEMCDPQTHLCVPPSPTCDPLNVQPETCNGLDDDCDGSTDEDTASNSTCAVGSSGAIGAEVCYAGRILCRANPSSDPLNPVVLSGTLTNVLLPAGEYVLNGDIVSNGYLRIDDNAHVLSPLTAGNQLQILNNQTFDVGKATLEGLGYRLEAGTDTWFEGTTLIGSSDGTRFLNAFNTADVTIRNGRVTNLEFNVRSVFAEFTRFESTDTRVRVLLDIFNGGYVGDNQFVGYNIVPRVQDGLHVTGPNVMVRDNRFEYTATAIRIEGTSEVYDNAIFNADIGIDIWRWANIVADANLINLKDPGHVGAGVRFFDYRAAVGAVLTNTTIETDSRDDGVLLDPDVFSTTMPANLTGTTITGPRPERRWMLSGDGNGHVNILSLAPLAGATAIFLNGNVRQVGGSLSIDGTTPIRSIRPDLNWYIENTSGATLTVTDADIEDVRFVSRAPATYTNSTFLVSRPTINDPIIYSSSTATVTNCAFESTAPLANVNSRLHRGVQVDGLGVVAITGSHFKSLEWGGHASASGTLQVSSSTFEDLNAGLVAQGNGRLDPIGSSTFIDTVSERVTYGIIMLDATADSHLNVTSATFNMGAEDIPIALTPNDFNDLNPSTIAGLTFVNGEKGQGIVLRGYQWVANTTLQPLGGESTFTLYDQDFDIRGGFSMRVKTGVTLRGNPSTLRYLRAYDAGTTLTIEPGVLIEDMAVHPLNGGTALVDGVTFQSSPASRSRNYMTVGNNGTLVASNCTMVGLDSKIVGGIHVWGNGSQATITDCDGTDLAYGVWIERDSTAQVTGGVWEGFDRFFDVRRNANIAMTGVTMRDLNNAFVAEGLWTQDLEAGLNIQWSNMTFDIGADDIPFHLGIHTFLNTNTLTFTGTQFTNDQKGLGYLLRSETIWGGEITLNLLETPLQNEWRLTGDWDVRNASVLSIAPGVLLRNHSGTYRTLYVSNTATLNIDGAELVDLRVFFRDTSNGTILDSTLTLDFYTTFDIAALQIASPGLINVQNNLIRATNAAIGNHFGINITGTAAVAPAITNNTLQNFEVCIQNANAPLPLVSGTVYSGCLTDFRQN